LKAGSNQEPIMSRVKFTVLCIIGTMAVASTGAARPLAPSETSFINQLFGDYFNSDGVSAWVNTNVEAGQQPLYTERYRGGKQLECEVESVDLNGKAGATVVVTNCRSNRPKYREDGTAINHYGPAPVASKILKIDGMKKGDNDLKDAIVVYRINGVRFLLDEGDGD
jgi:hypothetical protein